MNIFITLGRLKRSFLPYFSSMDTYPHFKLVFCAESLNFVYYED